MMALPVENVLFFFFLFFLQKAVFKRYYNSTWQSVFQFDQIKLSVSDTKRLCASNFEEVYTKKKWDDIKI